ncbi:MAG: beta strand repeat-containing protein, partial [Dolichospermum sp.]
TVAIRAASSTAGDILYYATGTVTGSLNAFQTSINATGAVGAQLLNNNSATGSSFLDINVTAASTGDPYLSLTTSGATNWSVGIDNSDSDKLKIGANSNPSVGTPSMTLDTSGNLGLGTTSPSRKLSVVGTTDIISYSNGTTTGYLYSDNNGVGLFNGATATGTGIYARASNILDLYYNGNIGLRLNNLGRILIGSTTDYGEQLQVTGTGRVGNTTGGDFRITTNQANGTIATPLNMDLSFLGYADGVRARIRAVDQSGNTNASYLSFFVNTNAGSLNENMRITSTSNLLIGSTTDSGERLQVTGTAKITGASTLSGGVTLGHTGGVAITYPSGQAIRSVGGIFVDYGNGGTGDLVFRRGSGVLNTLILAVSDGAATFSSSVTAASGIITGNLTVDTNTLFVDATNNRVGVLTTTPSEPLHVAGNMLISGANSFKMRNLAGTDVNVIRAVSGGTSVLSTATLGNNIAIGTQSAHDFLLCSSDTERIRLSSSGWFSHTNATNPSSSVTDSYVQYSADVTAGNAAPHFRTENGAVIKLYQETTAVGNSIISLGGGNSVLDDTTFDGYTLRQIVKALRNQGILA